MKRIINSVDLSPDLIDHESKRAVLDSDEIKTPYDILLYSMENNDMDEFQDIINYLPGGINSLNKYQINRLLFTSVRKGFISFVKILIDNGIDLNCHEYHEHIGNLDDHPHFTENTPLILAINLENSKMVQFLLGNGGNPNYTNYSRIFPLMFAIATQNFEIIRLLINHGASINIHGALGITPLIFSIIPDTYEYGPPVRKILWDEDKKTNQFNIVKLLLDHGAKLEMSGGKNETALNRAVDSGESRLVKILCEYGSDIHRRRSLDSFSMRVPHFTIFMEALKLENIPVILQLIRSSTNLDHKDPDHGSILRQSIVCGAHVCKKKLIIKEMIKKGIDLEIPEGWVIADSKIVINNQQYRNAYSLPPVICGMDRNTFEKLFVVVREHQCRSADSLPQLVYGVDYEAYENYFSWKLIENPINPEIKEFLCCYGKLHCCRKYNTFLSLYPKDIIEYLIEFF